MASCFCLLHLFNYIIIVHAKESVLKIILRQSSGMFPILLLIIMSFFSLILFFNMTMNNIFSNSTIAYAHLYSNITQLWTDKLNNIKIQFSYLPEKPTAYNIIQLQFSVQNLQTGSHFKEPYCKSNSK